MSSNRDALNALIEAARDAEAPDAATRARLRAALMAKVAPPPPPPPPAGTGAVAAPVLGGGVVAVVALAASLVALRRDAPPRPPPPSLAARAVNAPTPRVTTPPPPVAAPAVTVRAPAGPASPAPIRRRSVVAPAAPVEVVVEVTPPAPSLPPPPAPPLEPPVPAAAGASAGPARGVDASVGLPADLVVLAEARALLRGGDARGAFTRLERFAAEHPEAPRRTEREGARLLARCAAGEVDGREVRAFVAQHGEGPLGAAVRERCADRLAPP